MKYTQILVLSVVFFLSIQATLGAKRTSAELQDSIKTGLKEALANLGENRNLRNAYYLYRAGQELKFDVTKLATELQLCDKLNKVYVSSLHKSEQQIYLLDLNRVAKCGHKDEKSLQSIIDGTSKSNLASDYILAMQVGLEAGLIKANAAACTRAVDFFSGDGTSLIDLNDKNQKSLYYTPFLVEIVEKCGTKPGILQSAVKNVLFNTYPIYKNGLSLVEGDAVFLATSQLVKSILSSDSLKSLKEYNERANQLAFFIQTHAQYITDGKDLYAYALVSQKLKNNLFVELTASTFDLSKKATWELSASVYDINFQPSKAAVKLTATVGNNKEKVTLAAKDGNHVGKFGSAINEPGYYNVKVELTSANYNSSYDTIILVRKKIQVDSVRFDVGTSNKRPTNLANEVKDGKTFGEVLKSNQNGVIFVSFKISGIESPAEVVLRLVHPQHRDATGTVPAKFNKDTYHYEAVLDLGNPDVILPYNAQYKLNLTVADLYGENVIQWTLANFQLSFTKNQQGNPPSDSDYKLQPEIKHIFPAERKKANPVITLVFSALAVVALLGFFYGLGVLQVNFGRYPSSGLGPVFALLFILNILALLGILAWFWLEINIFQTLGYLTLLIIPTVFIGNMTFNHLETQEDSDEAPKLVPAGTTAATEEEHKDDGDKKAKAAVKKSKKPKDE
eukprot:CAMPEP_0176438712 /NCGR_PEP_ID=MMETSP0127-20121128/19468_1 /TAXON_ID=938130 /ORGANISM="Platyophrya macrostoma, Strain WH" /LENGTH=676 /DNA_ID=CAMNT_0017822757 /DNA_START=40 /DNA_END=2070 /DNA_ORIENTATION=-